MQYQGKLAFGAVWRGFKPSCKVLGGQASHLFKLLGQFPPHAEFSGA
jgi:hypothetical protein